MRQHWPVPLTTQSFTSSDKLPISIRFLLKQPLCICFGDSNHDDIFFLSFFYKRAEDSSKGDQKGVIGVEFQHKESPIVNFVGEVDAVVGPTIRANVTTGYEV